MNQEENNRKPDKKGNDALGNATYAGMVTGAILCALLVVVSEFVLDLPVIGYAAWMIWFAMRGSVNVVLFKNLKEKRKLIFGIVEFVIAVAFGACIVLRSLMK